MIYRANFSFENNLLKLPETGMGYQIIDAIRAGKYSSERFVIYNSELIVDLDSRFMEFKNRIIIEGYTRIFSQADTMTLSNPRFVNKRALFETRLMSESKKTTKGRHSGGLGAMESDIQYANGIESYVRLSAYENDKRIDFVNKKLKAGTFATTVNDYVTCKVYDDDPIDRYALPNDENINWAFYVKPKSHDKLQKGIVQPAFNHDGGGIEVYFTDGTSNDTYYSKTAY
ncbi:MAG: hypothetical protein ACOYOT_04720 [Bacteroidales bacterium]